MENGSYWHWCSSIRSYTFRRYFSNVPLLSMQITDFLMIRPSNEKSFSSPSVFCYTILCHLRVLVLCFANNQLSQHIFCFKTAIYHLKYIQSVSWINFFAAFISNLLQLQITTDEPSGASSHCCVHDGCICLGQSSTLRRRRQRKMNAANLRKRNLITALCINQNKKTFLQVK